MSRGRVVLLHGLAGSARSWSAVAARLGGRPDLVGVPVVAPTLPWHGAADPAWAWTVDPGAALASHVVPGDVVVAHSFAAALLLDRLCRDDAPRAAAVVLVAPFYRPDPRDFRWATLAHFLEDFHLLLEQGVRAAADHHIDAALLRDMACAVRERVGAHGWVRFFDAYLRTAGLEVTRVDPPLLVLHGADDDVAPPDDGQELALRVPGARLRRLPGTGHFPMLHAPDAVADAVADLARTAWSPTPQEALR